MLNTNKTPQNKDVRVLSVMRLERLSTASYNTVEARLRQDKEMPDLSHRNLLTLDLLINLMLKKISENEPCVHDYCQHSVV